MDAQHFDPADRAPVLDCDVGRVDSRGALRFEFPRSLVGIGLVSVVIGTSLYQLRKTYRPEVSKTEPGRLQKMTSFGISQETVKGRLLLSAAWWGIGALVAAVLIMLFG